MIFSQVREDPNIEMHCIDLLNSKNIDILCICSGGCNILSMLSDKINKIDGIDININQLFLTELKMSLCKYFSDKLAIIKFYQGEYDKDEYNNILNLLSLSIEARKYWYCNIDKIYYGINRVGKFEQLFRDLVNSNFNYKQIFDRENLIRVFGETAVIHSKKSFSDHFHNIINTYQNLYMPDDNYFYNQILYDKYNQKSLPPYLNNLDNIKENLYKINLINSSFIQFINNCDSESYHIIQTSNITDWINKSDMKNLILNIHRVLNKNGIVIMRRLLGDYILEEVVSKYFKIIDAPLDKSHFYSEIIIAQKI